MESLIIYNLKVGVCLVVFYLFYKLLLSRETFHRLNRILLLGAIAASFLLPICVVTIERTMPLPMTQTVQEPDVIVVEVAQLPMDIAVAPKMIAWEIIAGWLLLVGAAAMLVWTVWSVCSVLRLIGRGHHEKLADGSILVLLHDDIRPFSWGSYIVISERDYAQSGQEIILHERAHLRMHHSLDLILTDVAGCLQWFNPAMWLLRRELRALHEYEADAAVLDAGTDAKKYQLLLIKKAVGGRWYSIANSLNHNNLKNRITMMLQKRSSRWAGAKTLLLLPLTAFAIGAFAQTTYVLPDDKGKKENDAITASDTENVTCSLLVDNSMQDSVKHVKMTMNARRGAGQDGVPMTDQPTKSNTTVMILSPDDAPQTAGKIVTIRNNGSQKSINMDTLLIVDSDDNTSYKAVNVNFQFNEHGPLVVVDGEQTTIDELRRIDKDRIENVTIFKDSMAVEKYGEKARDGVMFISTDRHAVVTGQGSTNVSHQMGSPDGITTIYTGTITLDDYPEGMLVIIDGKKSTREDVKRLPAMKIERMYKINSVKGVEKYGIEAGGGVLEIFTRK